MKRIRSIIKQGEEDPAAVGRRVGRDENEQCATNHRPSWDMTGGKAVVALWRVVPLHHNLLHSASTKMALCRGFLIITHNLSGDRGEFHRNMDLIYPHLIARWIAEVWRNYGHKVVTNIFTPPSRKHFLPLKMLGGPLNWRGYLTNSCKAIFSAWNSLLKDVRTFTFLKL